MIGEQDVLRFVQRVGLVLLILDGFFFLAGMEEAMVELARFILASAAIATTAGFFVVVADDVGPIGQARTGWKSLVTKKELPTGSPGFDLSDLSDRSSADRSSE